VVNRLFRLITSRLGRPGLVRDGVANVASNALTIILSIGTGALLARGLGVAGRGELAAIAVAPPLIAAVFGMGCSQAITYEQARNPASHQWLIASWALILLPCAVAALVTGEIVLHITLAKQSLVVQQVAAVYMPVIVVIMLGDICLGILLGDHHFTYYNLWRLSAPAMTLVGYGALRVTGHFTVTTAVAVMYAVAVVGNAVIVVLVVRRYGIGRPDWGKARTSFWYGFRAHGTNVSQLVNLRLDQLILPAFVVASSLGTYAVAVSVSYLAFSIGAPLATLVLPAAARRSTRQGDVVRGATQASVAVAFGIALVVALAAAPAVAAVYGSAFAGSVGLIRLLLPGTVMYVAAYTLWQGLYAAGKPFSAALAQLVGMVVTIAGLFLTLPGGGGITAAAIVSSLAYGAVMVCSLVLYCRATGVRARSFIRLRGGHA
jgi:O-antigen/teichoic acid export membrane protein